MVDRSGREPLVSHGHGVQFHSHLAAHCLTEPTGFEPATLSSYSKDSLDIMRLGPSMPQIPLSGTPGWIRTYNHYFLRITALPISVRGHKFGR